MSRLLFVSHLTRLLFRSTATGGLTCFVTSDQVERVFANLIRVIAINDKVVSRSRFSAELGSVRVTKKVLTIARL